MRVAAFLLALLWPALALAQGTVGAPRFPGPLTPGSYGAAASTPQITVDAQGRVSAVGAVATAIAAAAITDGTATGRSLVTASNAAAARTTLGVSDYQVGSFTPTLGATSTSPSGVTYSLQSGTYVRLGRLVVVSGRMTLSNAGSGGAGTATISGLPVAVGVVSFTTNFRENGITLPAGSILGGLVQGTAIQLQTKTNTGVGDVAIGALSNSADFIFSATYLSN